MKISEISPDTHFVQMNLSEVISQLGEDDAKHILSSFSCPLNLDVENFLKTKAIEFSKRGFLRLIWYIGRRMTEMKKNL